MTPSQSKMNTSTFGRRSLAGSVSFRTLALRDVVEENVLRERFDTAAEDDLNADAAGEKARADVAIKAAERAVLAICILLLLAICTIVVFVHKGVKKCCHVACWDETKRRGDSLATRT